MKDDLSASAISPQLVAAYNSTNYRVLGQEPFDLRIGQASDPLLGLYEEYRCASAALITAWNPFSVAASNSDNAAAEARLERELVGRSIPFIKAIGEDTSGGWPSETGVLALGITMDVAKTIGNDFRQNAIVWIAEDGVSQLIILR